MNRRKFLMGAAISGIVAGSTVLLADDKKEKAAKHDCKGKNECKGQGGCKASAAGCAGKNECKGQGGCSTMAKKDKKEKKSA
jgi:gas vesicle protein